MFCVKSAFGRLVQAHSLLFRSNVTDRPAEQRRGRLREFRRSNDGSVSCRQNTCERREDAHDRVVAEPSNHAEADIFHARRCDGRKCSVLCGQHPTPEVAAPACWGGLITSNAFAAEGLAAALPRTALSNAGGVTTLRMPPYL